ncbi:unnamed protein product [Miscanthus lutarioriparius]|uniref:RING-type E3 ubiquitin transferase n=1 Tax=Miscanthus lutarioriparius TaxID=422564 RepID=A0A811P209_9POAL|nr:unnamed protein product [Miscanthus lutarioriparius]
MEGGMDEKAHLEKLSSAAAFVEGGVQSACDDACSICLEAFSDSDPSAVTSCKHEFHLQCILGWCQRSSQCPMCWQAISMKDPMSQELLEAVEQERNVQENRARTTAVFCHPLLGDFEVPVGADDAELEERIMQHLAAAAAIRRSHHHARREGRRNRSAAHGHPQIPVVSATDATSGDSISSNPRQEGDSEHSPAIISGLPVAPVAATEEAAVNTSVHDTTTLANGPVGSNNRVSGNQSSPDHLTSSHSRTHSNLACNQFQQSTLCSFKLQRPLEVRYKDSITKNTRGWKERGKEEVNAGIDAVSRMMERLETRDGTGPSSTSPNNIQSTSDTNNQSAVPPKFAPAVYDASSSAAFVLGSGSQ